MTALKRSTLYRRIKQGKFPKQIKLGEGSRAVGWLKSQVEDWIRQQLLANGLKLDPV